MGKFRPHVSPAMLVALLALIVALGGTAIAATNALSGKQKKESGKIASKVFNKRIGGASVSHANSADTATQASKAATATKATEATKAATATTAGTATEATRAKTATSAEVATKATDAERFGGRIPAEYQRKLKAGCLPPSAIAGISNEGDVTCAFPVQAISSDAAEGEVKIIELGNGLRLLNTCNDGGQVEVDFLNVGGATAAQIGWIYGKATEAATAGQESLASGSGEKDFEYAGKGTMETRVVYSISNQVMNVNLDARQAGGACEVRGTYSVVGS